jgi:phosphatidylserine/phosphatidylglycerophosphate/cardiolipin synthase-like enzyme
MDLQTWTFDVVKRPSNENTSTENLIECILWGTEGKTEILYFGPTNSITRTFTIKNKRCSYALKFSITRSVVSPEIQTTESEQEAVTTQYLNNGLVTSRTFSEVSECNDIEICIDGLQTFGRYYHYMMQATHSIDILGWELSLAFGLYYKTDRDSADSNDKSLLSRLFGRGRWITLRDVLLSKAAAGVRIRIMIWRHRLLSYANRFMYMGEVTIEREVKKLQQKAKEIGLTCVVFHTDFNLPNSNSKYADPFANFPDANIVFVIVGNPKGLVSCHHEKLVLIDAEIPNRCVSFIGGFDMARGRFDQPLHLPPLPLWDFSNILSQKPGRYGDRTIQPFLRNIRFLWHDNQIFIRGAATRIFHLHFVQRWVHAFTGDNHAVRHMQLPVFENQGTPMNDPENALIHRSVHLRVLRSWPGVFATHTLLDNFISLISNANESLYIEHQYPFHDVSLTQCLCERLRMNQNLKVIIIMPVKSDLPSGVVGTLLDMSQDQIFENLQIIYNTASERVGVYGLLRQEQKTETIKSIYVHSKLMIVDDKILCNGSANMDNLSFQQSSEYNVNIFSEKICIETRRRLVQEHLEYWTPEFIKFSKVFDAFRKIGNANLNSIEKRNMVIARPVPLVPLNNKTIIVNVVNYPNPIAKMMFKMGFQPDQLLSKLVRNLELSANDDNTDDARNSFFLQSML